MKCIYITKQVTICTHLCTPVFPFCLLHIVLSICFNRSFFHIRNRKPSWGNMYQFKRDNYIA